MGTLNFMAPVAGEISGKFGEPRQSNGKKTKHFGVDYAVRGESVQASERGEVVRASFNQTYGFVVVIDHAPRADEMRACPNTRNEHIYTLYAHLEGMSVNVGDTVDQGDVIGISGNTGTDKFYKNKDGQYHLHFEVIHSGQKLCWNEDGGMNVVGASGDHKNPKDYLNRDWDIEGTLDDITEEEEDSLIDSIQVIPEYCPNRADALRLHVSINGKKVGYLNDDIKKITVNAEFDYNGDFTIE